MFTPTELLKQYLKEAFAREGIAASDQRIKTWSDLRHDLGRNVFGVLRTGSGSGSLVMKESLPSITQAAVVDSFHWFEDFDNWQRSAYLDRLKNAAKALKDDPDAQIAQLGGQLLAVTERSLQDGISSVFQSLSQLTEVTRATLAQLRQKSDAILKGELNRQLNRNREFLAELFQFIQELKSNEPEDDADELEPEEDDELAKSKNDAAVAMSAYIAAIRALARGTVSRRMPKKDSASARVVNWLGPRGMSEGQLREVGMILVPQVHLRVLVNPVKRHLDGMSSRYRVGHENEIRVFDVQHIKGLEFEAVFFANLDRLADEKADLFPSYLYVGSTRAATYLGLTCEKSLPTVLAPTRKNFVSAWG